MCYFCALLIPTRKLNQIWNCFPFDYPQILIYDTTCRPTTLPIFIISYLLNILFWMDGEVGTGGFFVLVWLCGRKKKKRKMTVG